jgi:hypothetical protein
MEQSGLHWADKCHQVPSNHLKIQVSSLDPNDFTSSSKLAPATSWE